MPARRQNRVSPAILQAVGANPKAVQRSSNQLGNAPSMSKLGSFKGCGLVYLLLRPDGKQDAYPDIGQGTHGNRVAFALRPFALIILLGPAFRARTVKSKLVQRIAQRFDAAQTTMSLGIHAALEEDRRGSGQSSYIPPVENAAPAHPPAEDTAQGDRGASEPEPPLPATLLVFKDGHTLEISNYAIVGPTLFDLTAGHPRRIPLSALDLEATRRQNEQRGVTFELPESGQGG